MEVEERAMGKGRRVGGKTWWTNGDIELVIENNEGERTTSVSHGMCLVMSASPIVAFISISPKMLE